jgi:hypothetical protein
MRLLLLTSLLLTTLAAFAQVEPTADTLQRGDLREIIAADSLPPARQPREVSPKRALRWAIIPGGGQVYNRRWWKVPLVYTAVFAAYGVADFNTRQYNRYRAALTAECFGIADPDCTPTAHEFTPLNISVSALRTARDRADRGRQTAYALLVGTYLLQGIEAFVDAHLRTFDIEDDIGFRIEPALIPGPSPTLGVGLTIPIGR